MSPTVMKTKKIAEVVPRELRYYLEGFLDPGFSRKVTISFVM